MHGAVGCTVSIADMADRPPRMLADGEVVDIGGKRIRYIDTQTFRTGGMRVSSLKRPQRPFYAATFLRNAVADRPLGPFRE